MLEQASSVRVLVESSRVQGVPLDRWEMDEPEHRIRCNDRVWVFLEDSLPMCWRDQWRVRPTSIRQLLFDTILSIFRRIKTKFIQDRFQYTRRSFVVADLIEHSISWNSYRNPFDRLSSSDRFDWQIRLILSFINKTDILTGDFRFLEWVDLCLLSITLFAFHIWMPLWRRTDEIRKSFWMSREIAV